ncbi:hypothetical protein F11_01170 [Rhodospirillum rubrum F11]|nr:hypothetical protein [Rhodospirillum rubrum]AEO46704.1 hypothetical protein F11_01170 [Rhodospirillum rubrum F11]QXG80734.1 hypothetical protein KUL73_01230 [Rhodospirillum rubrum]
MMIYGVGDRVVIAPIAMGSKAGDRVDYHPIPVSLVPATAFEDGVDAFFDAVTTTCARAQDGASLKLVLAQLQEERQTPDVASWRRLEARLGYDPDQVPDALIEALSRQEELIGAEGVEEAALGNPGARAPEILEKVLSASRESSVEIDLAEALAAAAPVNRADLRRPIWMVAEDAADRLRRAVGWSEGPFSNVALSDILKVSWKAIRAATATARDLPYGARLRGGGTTEKIALQTQASHDRRFELARVLGDALWTADSRFGVISRGKTDRQKFQRAFAQSLLCPFADLSRHVDLSGPSEEQIAKAARRYLVNRNVVTTLLVNKGHLSRETLGDVLDAA